MEFRFRFVPETYGTPVPFVKSARYDRQEMSTAQEDTPRQRADARRNRERILAAAKEAFAECGPSTQMDDVARRAGVGVGTVYRHFPTKDALVAELIRTKLFGLAERARGILAEPGDPWEDFTTFVRRNVADMAADASHQNMWSHITPEAHALAADARAEISEASGQLIARAQEAGALRPDFGVENMPTLMCAVGSAIAANANSAMPHDWDKLLTFLLDGLRVRA